MVEKANLYDLTLRPHFKTHQSAEVGAWFRAFGVTRATVSSIRMAHYFVASGWNDLTIAFPVNIREWEELVALSNHADINIILSSPAVIPALPISITTRLGVFIKVDVGTHRTGFDPSYHEVLDHAVEHVQQHPGLEFKGLLCHTGHTYACRSSECIEQAHQKARDLMISVADRYRSHYPDLIVSMGDTPSCSVSNLWDGINEIRPGNFVFYDLMQVQIGSCKMEDIAVCLACPVVAKHSDRQSIVVYGGGIHLSKDRLQWGDQTIYGLPVLLHLGGWEMPDGVSTVTGLSQEHGVLHCSPDLFKSLKVGDLVGILPVHSCMTCDLMKAYTTLDEQKTITMMA